MDAGQKVTVVVIDFCWSEFTESGGLFKLAQ